MMLPPVLKGELALRTLPRQSISVVSLNIIDKHDRNRCVLTDMYWILLVADCSA